MSKSKTIHITPFSHLDLFWAGSRNECLSRGITIIKTALNLLDKYPDYRFMIEATNFLEFFLQSCPDEKPRIQKHIDSSHLEVIPMRSITYTQLPSGETLIRNILHGREFCMREYGCVSKIISMSDIPGVTPQMPQIALGSGMEALFLSHGCPPHTDHINYRALDGSNIKSYAPIHYAKCLHLLGDAMDYGGMLDREEAFNAYFQGMDYDLLCQLGMDLCVLTEENILNIMRWNDDGHAPLKFSTFTEFFTQHYPDNPKQIAGEIPSLWPNVESSWPDIWPLDLPCEQAMFNAEFFSVLTGNKSYLPMLRQAWDWLLDSMDHNQNGIGGSYSDDDKRDQKVAAKLTAEQIVKQLAWPLAAQATSPDSESFPIVVFNLLSWQRSERIETRGIIYGPSSARHMPMRSAGHTFRLVDEMGKEIPFRVIEHREMIANSIDLEFYAEDIPALSAKVYYIQPIEHGRFHSPFTVDDGDERDKIKPQNYAGISTIESPFLRLEIDRVTGEFSVFDKSQGRMVLERAGILALEEKRGDYICKMDLTGRVIPAVIQKLELIDHSPVAYRVNMSGTVYGQQFMQTLTLDANRSILEIQNTIDWQGGCYARFEQIFPFASKGEAQTHYGVPFGSVQYPQTIYTQGLNFEDLVTPERGDNPDDAITRIRLVSKWIALRDKQSTLTIGTGNRMWELDGNTVRNCMFRGIGNTSGGYLIHEDGTRSAVSRPPADTYTFKYTLRFDSSQRMLDGHCGWEHNVPLYPVSIGCANVADMPGLNLPVMPDTTGTSLILCNVKPALANDNHTVFRCFETAGRTATLKLPRVTGKCWYQTNLMEEQPVACESDEIAFEAYQIKTFMLKSI
jgi:alpha-mannosidase